MSNQAYFEGNPPQNQRTFPLRPLAHDVNKRALSTKKLNAQNKNNLNQTFHFQAIKKLRQRSFSNKLSNNPSFAATEPPQIYNNDQDQDYNCEEQFQGYESQKYPQMDNKRGQEYLNYQNHQFPDQLFQQDHGQKFSNHHNKQFKNQSQQFLSRQSQQFPNNSFNQPQNTYYQPNQQPQNMQYPPNQQSSNPYQQNQNQWNQQTPNQWNQQTPNNFYGQPNLQFSNPMNQQFSNPMNQQFPSQQYHQFSNPYFQQMENQQFQQFMNQQYLNFKSQQSQNNKSQQFPNQQEVFYQTMLTMQKMMSQNQQKKTKDQEAQEEESTPKSNSRKNIIRKRISNKKDSIETQNSEIIIGDEIKAQTYDRIIKKQPLNKGSVLKSQEQKAVLIQIAIQESLNKVKLQPLNKLSFVGQRNQNPKLKLARKELQEILKEDKSHAKYHQVTMQIQKCKKLEEIIQILSQYTKKKTAQKLAQDFFYALGKDKIVISKIQLFYDTLRKHKMPGQDINIVRSYVQKGKRWKIHQFLAEKLGIYQGKNIFNQFSSEFPQHTAEPLPKSKKIFRNESGLQIYQYPESSIQDFQKMTTKTLIVLGQTGCGKSTFLNSLVNYLAGVQVEDPFRYFIVIENTTNQINSITNKISVYYVKDIRTNDCYRVIDTPGFGDTGGINKDYQTVKKIQHLFKKQIDSIHLVLFLIKASTIRMTPYHRYIFQNVMDLFDKTIAENFVFVLTFADASKSIAVDWIQDSTVGFGSHWNVLKEPKVIEVNNSGFFQKVIAGKENDMVINFWKIGCTFISKLIQKAGLMNPKSLNTTKTLITQKQQLSLRIKDTAQKIQYAVSQQENIREQMMLLIENEENMKKNENFEYEVNEIEWYAEQVSANVTRCNNCLNSNCHDNCTFGDGENKKSCVAMDKDGYCTVCPGKCLYVNHTNDHFVRKSRTIKKIQTKQDLKAKYYDAKDKISWYEQSLMKIIQNYEKVSDELQQSIKEMAKLQQSLSKISLSKNKPLSTRQYILFLIENEKAQRKDGYTKRIQSYNLTLQQLEIEERTAQGKTYQDAEEKRRNLLTNLAKDKRAKQSSFFDKFLSAFSFGKK